MADNKVNGPEDAVISEMIKQLPLVKIHIFSRTFHGQMKAPRSWKSARLVLLRKPDAEPKKGIRSQTGIALTSVMSIDVARVLVVF